MTRVLMLGWEYPPHIAGGLGAACAGITRGLAAHDVDVTFVVPRVHGDEDAKHMRLVEAGAKRKRRTKRVAPNAYETQTEYETRVAGLTGRYGGRMIDEVRRYADAVVELAESERFDLVHGHDWMTYPAAARASGASEIPLVLHVHSIENDRAGPRANPEIVEIERLGLDAADVVVCVSRHTADEVARRYGVPEKKLRVLHNAVDASVQPPRGPRRIAEPVVLFLGRVTYQKGPEAFLEAAARVVKVEPRVKFVVAGDGDLWRRLVERAATLGLARHVHFTGFLGRADVERAYASADVLVMPSVSEPFGIAPLEAAARDVPTIVSRRSGVVEVMRGALVVDSWDVPDLATKILDVIRRPELAADLARRGREDARRLTWEGQGARLRSLYEEALA